MRLPEAPTLLTLDRGNTTLDCMLTGDGGARRRRLDPQDEAGLRAFLAPPPDAALGCSVVAGGLDRPAALLGERGVPLLVAGRDLPCPLEVRYAEPSTLGVDRWVAALAAQREWGQAVVVDCGTALTVGLVTNDGVFLGGAIAPGLRAMTHGLRALAPGLPSADVRGPVEAVPTTTRGAVDAGVVLAFCGAVDRLVHSLSRQAGFARPARLITGGDAEVYLANGGAAFVHVPDLVHRGLRWLWRDRARTP